MRLWQIQSVVAPPRTVPESVHGELTQQPTNQPRRNFNQSLTNARTSIAAMPTLFADTKQFTLAENPQIDKWGQPTNQFRQDLRRIQYEYPSFFVDNNQLTLAEQARPDKWAQPTTQPRFDLKRLQNWYPSFWIDSLQLSLPENVYEEVIQQPPNQPRFDLKRPQHSYPSFIVDSKQLTLSELAQLDKLEPRTS